MGVVVRSRTSASLHSFVEFETFSTFRYAVFVLLHLDVFSLVTWVIGFTFSGSWIPLIEGRTMNLKFTSSHEFIEEVSIIITLHSTVRLRYTASVG